MHIHFSASVYQQKKYDKIYQRIVAKLLALHHTVQHEHMTELSLDQIYARTPAEMTAYYKQVIKWINQADIVVFEASFPSTLNIGHEISLAMERGKPVMILYQKGFASTLFQGLQSDKLTLVEYQDHNLEQLIADGIAYCSEMTDARFNFFISNDQSSYLEWVSRKHMVPRSTYLRQLIDWDKKHNQEYQTGQKKSRQLKSAKPALDTAD